MTSGRFTSLPIADITVQRNLRIRRELAEADIASRAESIARIGLIHPIVVTPDNILIAGETRLRACQRLGWTHIPVQFSTDLSEEDQLALELEENVKRKDLDWKDQCDALRRFHELKKGSAAEWSSEDTAREIGIAPRTVREQLGVAKELAKPDSRIATTKEYTVARGIVKRAAERAASDQLSTLRISVEPEALAPVSPILNVDFKSWVETYDGPAFNFINTDFPYGIGADKFNQGAAAALGGYADTPETYWSLVNCLLENRQKLLGNSGHVLFWFSMRYYRETLERLSEHFWVDPYPVVWLKTDNKGTLPDPTRGPRRVYEVAFVCSHGDRKILSAVANTFGAPTVRLGEHMSEKSQPMLEHFFRMFVDKDSRVLDPTCGSGSALRAARTLGAASVLGLEINPDFADAARRAWER